MPTELLGKQAPDLRARVIILVLVLVVETILLGGGYLLILRSTANRTDQGAALASRRETVVAELKKKEDVVREAVTWNKQRIAASSALDRHIRWTGFFELLESVTLPTVTYLNFSGDADAGTVTLDATARGYRDVAEQVLTLRAHPSVRDVRTSSASARVDETGTVTDVAFSMVVKFDPAVWKTRKP